MCKQNRLSFVCFAAISIVSITMRPVFGESETFYIDSSRSEFSYASSPWPGDLPCRTMCNFGLSGLFDAETDGQSLSLTNPRLFLNGHESSSSLQSIAVQKFPKSAPASPFGDDEVFFAEAQDARFADGDAYSFYVFAFAAAELDCDGNGIVDFEDVLCLEDSNRVLTVLDVSDVDPGDTDGNGSVGFEDFLVVSKNFGKDAGYRDGDVDLSGAVGFGDFLIVSSKFESVSNAAAVPEPECSPLWLAGALFLVQRKRRRGENKAG